MVVVMVKITNQIKETILNIVAKCLGLLYLITKTSIQKLLNHWDIEQKKK